MKVAGVFEHYVGNPIVISPAYFERVFLQSCEPNAFFVRLNGADKAALGEALRGVRGFLKTTGSDYAKTIFDASTNVIDKIVLLFIFMAAVMAGVVLMNLTSIYVLQKKRELTIMRINGFTSREVVSYMLRETVLTTLLGILIGLWIGTAVALKICLTIEQTTIQLDRAPSMLGWAAGVGLTVLFTVLVNLVALRPVKKLKLTDLT